VELPEEDNFWLTNLRNDLTKEQMECVITASEGRTGIDAYLYAIGEANAETLEELYMQKKEGVILTEKLDAIFITPRVANGKAKSVLTVLRKRFRNVPLEIETAVLAMTDLIALESLLEHAVDCETLDEFSTALK
jgi:hypothetical protein